MESAKQTDRPNGIAGVVVLYNSGLSVFDRIKTYLGQIEKLYVVDNSEHTDSNLVKGFNAYGQIQYIANNGNRGIASALNVAARQAVIEGFTYLLTMDDDTAAPPDMVAAMINFLKTLPEANRVGIVSAVHNEESTDLKARSVLTTMTSGNLLNLDIYTQVGPFRDEFFIDHVDHEYGLRLNQANFLVIELPYLLLDHRLGERRLTGWRRKGYVSHSPVRGYYIVRNGLVLYHEFGRSYPEYRQRLRTLIAKEFIKALIVEPQKRYRLRLLWQGLVDGQAGRLGKFAERT